MHASWTICYLVVIVSSCSHVLQGSPSPAPTNGIGSLKLSLEASKTLKGLIKKSGKEEEFWHGRELEIVDYNEPGSKPPKCASKCGKCTPCTPVRVPVQAGPHKTSEYYPEAWRCKCKGKLYMP